MEFPRKEETAKHVWNIKCNDFVSDNEREIAITRFKKYMKQKFIECAIDTYILDNQ